jgi:hypothetical protein
MKSIKEKAEERAPYTKTDSWGRIKAAINAQTSFEAGANYVLDEVEYILENKELDCEEICDELIALIEQLKK